MKNKWFTWTIGGILVVGLAIVSVLAVNGRGLWSAPALQQGSSTTLAQSAQNQPAQSQSVQNDTNSFVGAYSGDVKLNTTVAGVYSDTLATPPPPGAGTPTPPDLGSIDLSLQLNQKGNALSGYVSLDKTLVYSVEHTLGSGASAVQIGPLLSGVVNGSNINVQSEKVSLTVSGRDVQRQFRLVSTKVTGNGGQLSGEYRETLWGYTAYPITIIGSFTLQRAGSNAIVPVMSASAPTVGADTATTTQGKPVKINVLGNDSAANGGKLTIISVGKPQFGTATTDGKTVTYTPNANFTGTDTFSYVISDGKGGTSTGSVAITVNAPGGGSNNQPPTAANDSVTTKAGVAVTIDVLANDSDPDGDSLTITTDGPPSHGTATVNHGKIIYTPAAGFSGMDTFTYIISDGKGGTATGSVSIIVNATGGGNNQPPTAANDSANTTAGTAVIIDVLANDDDPDGNSLTIAIDSPPSHGTATIDQGKVIYTPQVGFSGSDSFTYTICDGKGGTATATVTITVGSGTSGGYLPFILH
jgi:hypothetical protein